MSKTFIKRNLKLLSEFDEYMMDHPELLDEIPNNAYVIITVNNDETFNTQSASMIKRKRKKKIVEAHKLGNIWSIRPLQTA